jgi:hypothetical protein
MSLPHFVGGISAIAYSFSLRNAWRIIKRAFSRWPEEMLRCAQHDKVALPFFITMKRDSEKMGAMASA